MRPLMVLDATPYYVVSGPVLYWFETADAALDFAARERRLWQAYGCLPSAPIAAYYRDGTELQTQEGDAPHAQNP